MKQPKFNGATLEGWRERRHWTATEAARQCGISQAYWHQLVKGEANPTFEVLWRIAHTFAIMPLLAELERFTGGK